MKKLVDSYHNEIFNILKLGCNLPNLAKICLHSFTSALFYPFTESDKDSLSKVWDDMVGGPSIVFTRKTVIHQAHIRQYAKICKSIVGINASHLIPYSICQTMPRRIYTRYEFDAGFQSIKPCQHKCKSRIFETMFMSYA